MDILSVVLIIAGLILFETVSSIDNAVINAQVLSTMSERARRWFLLWGLLIAVFLLRGLLPFAIVWITNPSLGPLEVITAAFSSDPKVHEAVAISAPILLIGGGTFLIFLFFLGNGIGAFVVREVTIHNIERIQKYVYLKNGAMYSIFFLGMIMILNSFGFHIPEWFAPIVTAVVIRA